MKVFKIVAIVFFGILAGCSSGGNDGPSGPIIGGPSDDIDPGPTDDGPVVDDDIPANDPFLYSATQDLNDVASFPIGNIASATKLASTSADNETFKQVLNDEYNSITAENDMKMANMFTGPDTYDFSDGDAIVAYAKENGFRVHGHTLVWHQSIPGWLNSFAGTDEEFEAQVEGYVKATVAHFAEATNDNGDPIVTGWDVLNEYFDGGSVRNTLFLQRIGDDYHKKLYLWAREADPDVKLFYNDYNIAGDVAKRTAVLNLVSDFETNSIPIDGIGMQMHLNHDWPSSDLPTAVQDIADTGLLVHVSELDVKVNYSDDISALTEERAAAQEVQFQRVGYYYSTLVPSAQQYGITLWGCRDRDSWLYAGGTEWPLLYSNEFVTKISHRGLIAGLNEENPD
ncbi:MAG: endo-1,4-beta-xylanase [Allomuricauda sp.]